MKIFILALFLALGTCLAPAAHAQDDYDPSRIPVEPPAPTEPQPTTGSDGTASSNGGTTTPTSPPTDTTNTAPSAPVK